MYHQSLTVSFHQTLLIGRLSASLLLATWSARVVRIRSGKRSLPPSALGWQRQVQRCIIIIILRLVSVNGMCWSEHGLLAFLRLAVSLVLVQLLALIVHVNAVQMKMPLALLQMRFLVDQLLFGVRVVIVRIVHPDVLVRVVVVRWQPGLMRKLCRVIVMVMRMVDA